ncbi:putative LRR receptor serine/threonine-protein kinase [Trifolium repens]|nr:putative LRR receptor serine/threonine-protein kinase [Trifolium repens]
MSEGREREVVGGLGKVYKGVLADSTKVDFKRLTDYESPGGDAAFQREVEINLSVAYRLRHARGEGFGRKVGGMAACRGESEARIRHITKKI